MAKKQFFCIIDTETTQNNLVADFAAVIVDRHGQVYNQCAVLTDGIFTDYENSPLFFTSDKEGIWSKQGQDKRYSVYNRMVAEGARMVASVSAINNWLAKAAAQYSPIVTAYNFAFDRDKCRNTGIDLTVFSSSFCLWHCAVGKFANTKQYKRFVLENHGFNMPTSKGNMTFKTNAEIMARFVLGQPDLADEPHTALEDVIFYELPIFKAIFKRGSVKKNIENSRSYNWRDFQVKDHFSVK